MRPSAGVALLGFSVPPAISHAQQNTKRKGQQRQHQVDSERNDQTDQQRASGSKESSDSITGGGTVERSKKVQIPGTTIENLVVLVKMKKPGSDRTITRVVDLGPVKDLKSIRVRQGDNIKVTGRVIGVRDKQVLMADEVTAHDTTQKIKRQKPKSASEKSKDRKKKRNDDS